jgi:hypothetical protein
MERRQQIIRETLVFLNVTHSMTIFQFPLNSDVSPDLAAWTRILKRVGFAHPGFLFNTKSEIFLLSHGVEAIAGDGTLDPVTPEFIQLARALLSKITPLIIYGAQDLRSTGLALFWDQSHSERAFVPSINSRTSGSPGSSDSSRLSSATV